MTSNKPYLIRALNEWIIDNQMTPFLLVDANIEGVEVPQQHIRDGKIILNIAPGAVQEIAIEDEWIYFSARFSGQVFMINVPVNAVLAIYAKENSRGMMFVGDESSLEDNAAVEQTELSEKEPGEKKPGKEAQGKKPALRIVK
ncbi:MAG: ClpXP protease specificity-enhancing factor [Gammaproteobacteria bacterium]|nr:MAG: ClpXP protease specificity-enhancing factor [Gammaproteobacteria bacterium]RKZ71898.1 MAG: ClpXP protease specificity-enhancing factor [Gammaproteobacteria bacterium]